MPNPILAHRHLITMTLDVDFAGMQSIGATPGGLRRIAPVTGGHFAGPELSGTVLGGSDWVINRDDGVMVIDVRLTLKTDNGALIYLAYQGRFLAEPAVSARFARGKKLAANEYSLAIRAQFECGDPSLAWLNNVIAVGTGEQLPTGVTYTLFAVG